MVEYIKAVAVKAAGTAVVTFLAGFGSEAAINATDVSAVALGAQTAVAGALISVVIPAIQRVAAKAAATNIPQV